MKKQLLFLAIWTLVASSCNYISNPIPSNEEITTGKDCKDQPFPAYTSKKVILLEDYTGHTCLNCPAATKLADDSLKKKYPGQVIVVAIHAGPYAVYNRPPFTQNFTTVAGDFYDSKKAFSVSATGNPMGLINRRDFPKNHLKSKDTWTSEVSSLINTPVEADLQLMSEYNSTTGKACIFVQYKLPTTLTSEYKLIMMLTQDSIIGPQVNGSSSNIIQKYVFNDMLRANINFDNIWGDALSKGNGAWTQKKYQYTVKSSYNGIICDPKHCHVVGFIYDKANNRILQAAETELAK